MTLDLFIIIIVIILIGIFLYFKVHPTLANKPSTNFFHHTFDTIENFNTEKPDLKSQSLAWQKKMQEYGEILNSHNVGLVIFSHGTFVGEDPLGVTSILESLFPNFNTHQQSTKIKEFNRSFWSKTLKDQAYFHPNYVQLFEESLQQPISCINFSWSSGNYHAARFSGAIDLIRLISSQKKTIGNKRVLLIGHSHAGQIFSLVTHLISNSKIGLELKKILSEEKISISEELVVLNKIPLDFVMLGTPYVYPWPKTNKYKIIHLINHRNHPYLGGTPKGIFQTLDGDYIQQWGVSGSDLIASTKKERLLNKKLSPILGNGTNKIAWRKNISSRLRVPPYGETHLVDYLDNTSNAPNCIQTIFGHGVYTKYYAMLFNTQLICKYLYPSTPNLETQTLDQKT